MILTLASYKPILDQIPLFQGNYLEIGVYEGDMLRSFAELWPERMFYGIDPFLSDKDTIGHTGVPIGERMEKQRSESLSKFTLPNIKFFEQTSKSFLEEKSQDELDAMNVSVVYVDGNHSYEDTLTDLCLSGKLIKDGLIYIDDFDLPEVLKATHDFIQLNPNRIVDHDKHMIRLR